MGRVNKYSEIIYKDVFVHKEKRTKFQIANICRRF